VLPHHAGKCARLHGHSYRLEVAIRGALHADGPAQGMVEDFDTIAESVNRHVIDALDHQSLNEIISNPTCELIVQWIWGRLIDHLPTLDELVLWETPTSCAVLRSEETR